MFPACCRALSQGPMLAVCYGTMPSYPTEAPPAGAYRPDLYFDADGRRLSPGRQARVLALSGAQLPADSAQLASLNRRILDAASRRRCRNAVLAGFRAHAIDRGERVYTLRVSWPGVSAPALSRSWNRFVDHHLKPQWPRYEALRVIGVGTKTGVAHVHAVYTNGPEDQSWLWGEWGNFCGFPVVDLRAVRGPKGFGLAKYFANQYADYMSGQGGHVRYSCTRGWLLPDGSITQSKYLSVHGIRIRDTDTPFAAVVGGRVVPQAGGSRAAYAYFQALASPGWSELGAGALAFVHGSMYAPRRPAGGGPLPVVYEDSDGALRSLSTVAEILRAVDP
jgi:hypothetical protein